MEASVGDQNGWSVGFLLGKSLGKTAVLPAHGSQLLMEFIRRFLKSNSGATAPEYVLVTGLIVLVCVGTLQSLGNAMNATFSSVSASVGGSPPSHFSPKASTISPPASTGT